MNCNWVRVLEDPEEDRSDYTDVEENEIDNVDLSPELLDRVQKSLDGFANIGLIKKLARALLKEEGGLLEKSIGKKLDNSLVIAGDVILKRLEPIFRKITLESMEENRL